MYWDDEGESSSVTCLQCQNSVPADAQFCPSSGSPPLEPDAPLVCGACGHTVESHYEFCVSCGSTLSKGSGEGAAEQRDSLGTTLR